MERKNQKTCQKTKIQMKKILSGLMKPFGTDQKKEKIIFEVVSI